MDFSYLNERLFKAEINRDLIIWANLFQGNSTLSINKLKLCSVNTEKKSCIF